MNSYIPLDRWDCAQESQTKYYDNDSHNHLNGSLVLQKQLPNSAKECAIGNEHN
jgi:hypothetical protein